MKFDYKYPITCDDYVVDEKYIYFSDIHQNYLMKADKTTWQVELINGFPNQKTLCARLYKSCIAIENKIVFIPTNATEIAIFNKDTNDIEMVSYKSLICTRKTWCGNTHLFWTAVVYKRYVYFLGHSYPGIIKMNIDTKKLEYIEDWVKPVEDLTKSDCIEPYLSEGAVINKKGYFPILCADAILELDFENGNTTVHYLKSGVNGFNGVASDGDYLWITPRNSDYLLRLNINDYSFVKIDIAGFERSEKLITHAPFQTPIVFEDKIVLFPILEERALFINKKDLTISEIEILKNILSVKVDERCACFADKTCAVKKINENEIVFINGADGIWYKLNSYGQVDQLGKMFLSRDTYEQIIIRQRFANFVDNTYVESNAITLEDYIVFIKDEDTYMLNSKKTTCGQIIHNII